MRYQMLSSKAISIFREMQEFDRPDWKLKMLSRAQTSFLVRYVELTDLTSMDRGVAAVLMDCLFKLLNQDEEITDATVLGELYKIVKV